MPLLLGWQNACTVAFSVMFTSGSRESFGARMSFSARQYLTPYRRRAVEFSRCFRSTATGPAGGNCSIAAVQLICQDRPHGQGNVETDGRRSGEQNQNGIVNVPVLLPILLGASVSGHVRSRSPVAWRTV
jgi:hypothetical protein